MTKLTFKLNAGVFTLQGLIDKVCFKLEKIPRGNLSFEKYDNILMSSNK